MGVVEPVIVEAARVGEVRQVLALLRDDPAGIGVRGSFGKTLEHGADPTIRDSEFDSDAGGWAGEGGSAAVQAILEAHE